MAKKKTTGTQFYEKTKLEFGLADAPDLERLSMASKLLDEIFQAEQIIKKEGPFILDRFAQQKEHPAAKFIRDNRTLFCRIVRDLGLDLDPNPESRPPRQY